MLALMAAYERLGEELYLRSVRRAMAAYEKKWRCVDVLGCLHSRCMHTHHTHDQLLTPPGLFPRRGQQGGGG